MKIWTFSSFSAKSPISPNPLTTDDKFLIEIELHTDEKELKALLKETGAIDIKTIEKQGDHE